MSNRERWTIYPLLFLTLSIVLKDKLTKFINTDVVVCKTLVVTDRNQRERVIVSSNPAGGIVKADSSDHRLNVLLGHVKDQHGVMYSDASGNVFPMTFIVRPAPQVLNPDQISPKGGGAPPNSHQQQPAAENQDTSPPLPEEQAK